jgi:hypothetical protein
MGRTGGLTARFIGDGEVFAATNAAVETLF